jgi:2-iminobutanoate/2-iminopropanoate deaminase
MAKEIIFSEKAPAPIGPYSQAVKVNNTLYVSGQIAFEASQLGNIKIEAGAVMENIGHILKAAGLGYENVVKSNIYLKDMNDFTIVNEVYGQFFTSEPPARETVQVARLPKDVNVEISVIAVEL